MGEEEYKKAFVTANELRSGGIKAELDHEGRSLKAQFKYADKIGAKYVAVIGSDELNRGEVSLKNMADGETKSVKFEDLSAVLKNA